MELSPFIFIADSANVLDQSGLFDVINGGLDLVLAPTFPATKPTMTIIARVLFDHAECEKQYEAHGEMIDPSSTVFFKTLPLSFKPAKNRLHPDRQNWMTLCFTCQTVPIPRPGDYAFRLFIGQRFIGEAKFEAAIGGGC